MDEIVISDSGETEAEAVENTAEVITAAAVGETAGFVQGSELGAIKALAESILSRLDEMDREASETNAKLDNLISELDELAEAEATEAVAEVIEATAEAVEAEAEYVEAEAEATEAVAEYSEAEAEYGDEIKPASRRTHWYFRPAHEWRRD